MILELIQLWRSLNWNHFRDAMRPPVFELSDNATELGRWDSDARTISIARRLAFDHPWEAVEEVLKHEMAHQFVDEILEAHDETAHGPAFRSTCEKLGIDPAASGLPVSGDIEENAARVVEKISRLLSLAGSPNQHEAEAAAIAARRLMLKHNIDTARAPKRYAFKRMGKPSGRVEESARILSGILAGYFFVEALWIHVYVPSEMKHGRVLEIAGTPENLAIAEYVHAFLIHSAETLWQAHRQKIGLHSNRDRRTFAAGVMSGFSEKLAEEHRTEPARALVWVKDAELHSYFRQRHPRIVTRAHWGRERNASFHQGRDAGKKIVLSKPIETTTSSGRGRLLGSGSK